MLFIPNPDQLNEARPFLRFMAANESPVTHQDQARAVFRLRPGGLCRPRRTLVPLRVQLLMPSQIRGYRLPGSNPVLARVAGDSCTARVTAGGIPFRLMAGEQLGSDSIYP